MKTNLRERLTIGTDVLLDQRLLFAGVLL